MNIRAMKAEDQKLLKEIWAEFYSDEFSFPVFMENPFLCSFVAYDDDNRIISAGGVRSILEVVLVTDKRQSVRDRREALFNLLCSSSYVAEKHKYNQLHAFVQDDGWIHHLNKVGFRNTVGKSLVLEIS